MMERFTAGTDEAGQRLDHFVSARMPSFSRARVQVWIEQGRVRVGGAVKKASSKLKAGEEVEVEPAAPEPLRAFAEEIPLEVLYVDEDVVAINKPAGMVVHAGAGQKAGTLVNALLHHFESLSGVGGELRPGIVHRLDKGTSGVLLVAKNDAAHRRLAEQFARRNVVKVYLALVEGRVKEGQGVIERPIGRDRVRRTRMSVRAAAGRSAYTEWRVVERWARFTLLEIRIGTGRTHQIRVHLASMGHPVAGDTLYGAAAQPQGLEAIERPWLHAWRIEFESPSRRERVSVEAPIARELIDWKLRLGAPLQ